MPGVRPHIMKSWKPLGKVRGLLQLEQMPYAKTGKMFEVLLACFPTCAHQGFTPAAVVTASDFWPPYIGRTILPIPWHPWNPNPINHPSRWQLLGILQLQ